MAQRRDAAELKRKMQGRWLEALSHLAPCLAEAAAKPGRNVASPVDGRPAGFRLLRDAADTGGGCIQNEQVYPNGIDLLMRVLGWNFVETYDALSNWMGDPATVSATAVTVRVSPSKKKRAERNLRAWLNEMWMDAVPLTDPKAISAQRYFESRGILDAAIGQTTLRFHPALTLKDDQGGKGHYPAIIAKIVDNMNRPVALHRTYLTPQGKKLVVDGQSCRRMTPSVSDAPGRVIRLGSPVDGVLGIAEGLETALAVNQATRMPVWSCISATMMRAFEPPKSVNQILIMGDVDASKAGQRAAAELCSRLRGLGHNALVMLPKTQLADGQKSVDWADVLLDSPVQFDWVSTAFDLFRDSEGNHEAA